MSTPSLDASELFSAFDKAAGDVLQLVSSTGKEELNTIPFEGSWTPAQVAEHVNKSVKLTGQSLHKPGKVPDRNPSERAAEFRELFITSDKKFKSPPAIVPGDGPFEKEALFNDLKGSFDVLKTERTKVNMSESVTHPVLGELTRLELLYFLLYHTQRHLKQLEKVIAKVKESAVPKL